MKFKGTKSTIMFNILSCLALIGFMILASVSDIGPGGIPVYFLMWGAWLVIVLLAVLVYDYHIILRHLFAMYCVVKLFFGYLTKKSSKNYQYLYALVFKCETMSDYYDKLLYTYDVRISRKEKVDHV